MTYSRPTRGPSPAHPHGLTIQCPTPPSTTQDNHHHGFVNLHFELSPSLPCLNVNENASPSPTFSQTPSSIHITPTSSPKSIPFNFSFHNQPIQFPNLSPTSAKPMSFVGTDKPPQKIHIAHLDNFFKLPVSSENTGTLLVKNLPRNTRDDMLYTRFSRYGPVKDISKAPGGDTSRFVSFENLEDAEKARVTENKTLLMNSVISVDFSRKQSSPSPPKFNENPSPVELSRCESGTLNNKSPTIAPREPVKYIPLSNFLPPLSTPTPSRTPHESGTIIRQERQGALQFILSEAPFAAFSSCDL
ncbi:hypothetical protein BLNAU_6249 [Blattamonas nauphoetae]|uniref:RRM domain-containing protein n=1 Tax=Blattamonas nauphoetae TaxID=2049346 RepID=A0ABQ9Y4T0_9EUKA|nr:hypothetical protein BLNAU_6249 [Blattamonas nauphoetae]